MNEEIAYQQKKIADELWIVAMMGVEVADRVKPDNPKLQRSSPSCKTIWKKSGLGLTELPYPWPNKNPMRR